MRAATTAKALLLLALVAASARAQEVFEQVQNAQVYAPSGSPALSNALLVHASGVATVLALGSQMTANYLYFGRQALDAASGALSAPGAPLAASGSAYSSLAPPQTGLLHNGTDVWVCSGAMPMFYYDTSVASPAEAAVTPRTSGAEDLVRACASHEPTHTSVVVTWGNRLCRFATTAVPTSGDFELSSLGCAQFASTLPAVGVGDALPRFSPGGTYFFYAKELFNVAVCLADTAAATCHITAPYDIAAVDDDGYIVCKTSTTPFFTVLYRLNGATLEILSDVLGENAPAAGVIDSAPGTFYAIDYTPRIWRAFFDDFALSSIEQLTWASPSALDTKYDVDTLGTGIAVLGWSNSANFGIRTYRIFDCSSTDIPACISDKHHCRWLLSEQRCITMQVAKEDYSSDPTKYIDTARTVVSVEPNTGSTHGGTRVKIDVGKLWDDDSTLKCDFGGTQSAATYNTTTEMVECLTPPMTSGSGVLVNVIYKGKAVVPTSDKYFEFYRCETLNTCLSCTQMNTGTQYDSECAWCPLSRTCISTFDTCTRGDSATTEYGDCPQIFAINPSSGPMDAETPATVYCLNLIEGTNYSCQFGSATPELGQPNFATDTVSCVAPTITSGSAVEVVEVRLLVDGNVPYVSSDTKADHAEFTYYSCSHYTDCGNCTLHSCAWCIDGASRSFSCIAPSGTCAQSSATKFLECPAVVSLTPPSVNIEEDTAAGASSKVSVVVKLTEVIAGLDYFCPDMSHNATAVSTSANTITCEIERPAGEGGKPVDIFTRDSSDAFTLYADAGSFYFFNCSAYSSDCSTCVSQDSGLCGWCLTSKTGSCTPLSRCTGLGCWSNPTCPSISDLSPEYVNTEEPVVVVSGTAFPASTASARRFTCKLTLEGAEIASVAGADTGSGTTLNCSFGELLAGKLPAYNTTPLAKLSVVEDSPEDSAFDETANGRTAPMVNCTQDLVATTCVECVTMRPSYCHWSRADGFCTTSDRAHFGVTSSGKCPTLSIIEPTTGTTKGGDIITVIGTEFINDTSIVLRLTDEANVESVFYAPTMFVNSTRLTATMPETPAGRYSASLFLQTSSRVYAENSLIYFEFVKPQNLYWIIAVVGGVAIAAIIAVVLAAILVTRKRRGMDFKFDLKKNEPDFSRFAYATDLCSPSAAAACSPNDPKWAPLRTVLLEPQIASAVAEITQPTEADRVANSLVYINAAGGRATGLVLQFVRDEVQSVPHENQLFRGNSMASKSFRAFARMVGLRYLWVTLARFLNELEHLAAIQDKKAHGGVEMEASTSAAAAASGQAISILSTDIEIDPTKLSDGADEESQAYLLAQRSRALLLSVLASIPAMPPTIRWIVHNIREQVSQRFPGSEHIAIGGTVFLRFICPAITVPHTYALIKSPPKDRLQRQLILLSKVLQNLANSVLFGKKEPFMNNMNEFIAKNIGPLHEWMDQLADVSADAAREDASVVPAHIIASSLVFLRGHLATNITKLRAALLARGVAPQVVQQLENAIAQAPADR